MKVLLLFPEVYTLANTFSNGLKKLGFEVEVFDFRNQVRTFDQNVNTQMYRLPHKIRKKWDRHYLGSINKLQKDNYDRFTPDIVIVYNNEMLLPDTLKYFTERSKVIFFLGDNPFYTPTNDYYLDLLMHADLVISPDSFWTDQLKLMGIQNCITEYINTYKNNYELKKIESEQHDLLFVGMSYVNSWGYKRALFLSHFADFDLRIHGNSAWYRWLDFFPELKPKFKLKGNYSEEYMAQLYYNAKIYPFDSNPGILNGIHLRLFDCIEYGILPIPEYRKDIADIFGKQNLPIIYDYNKGKEIVNYYLKNESERLELIQSLKIFIQKNYNPEVSLGRIFSHI